MRGEVKWLIRLYLPAVDVDSYNVELKDNEGFIGDRASRARFAI